MESRKKRNQEIERRRREKQRIFTWILTAMICVAAFGIIYAVWDVTNRRTIMRFEGERIATSDYRFFHVMNGMPVGDEEGREIVLENLLQALVLLERGERHGFSATSEELSGLMESARNIREQHNTSFISERRIAEFISAWDVVYEKLMDEFVPAQDLDEAEFTELFDEHIEENRSFLEDLRVKYIVSFDLEEIILAYEGVTGGTNFDALIQQHSAFYSEEHGVESFDFWEFAEMFSLWEEWMELIELQEGEISSIFEADGLFFIVQMYERSLDIEAEEISFREGIIAERRAIAFNEIVEQWMAEANYTVNDRALNNF
jgi:hypothetical protein